jgi:hypothetical protein
MFAAIVGGGRTQGASWLEQLALAARMLFQQQPSPPPGRAAQFGPPQAPHE